jgi:hypothetical protein
MHSILRQRHVLFKVCSVRTSDSVIQAQKEDAMSAFASHHLTQDPAPSQRPFMPLPVVFDADEAARTRWEYRVVVVDPREEEPLGEARLSELGTDGWLLASVLDVPTARAVPRLYYYFVRAAI